MQYLFLLYRDEAQPMTREQGEQAVSRQWAILDETEGKGILRGASPLERSPATMVVRPHGDTTVATDGPFVETKEALGGFYLLECQDWEDAKYWAGRMAQTGCTTGVEIRPLAEIPARFESEIAAAAVHA